MRRSLRSWLWRVPIEQEVEEELAFHLEMRRREGKPLDDARMELVRRACLEIARRRDREMRLKEWLGAVAADVRFAIRQVQASPGFAAVAILTLALGIGANSAIFALVDATLIRPLPFPDPDRLVMVWERTPRAPRGAVAPLNFHDWHERNRTFEGMAAVFNYPRRLSASDGAVEQLPAQQVTPTFFDVLGARPVIGRTFLPSDVALPPNAVVLSEGLWRGRFGGDPSIAGRLIELDGQPFTVLGVVSADFHGIPPASLWTVWTELPGMDARANHFMRVVGRLARGATVQSAERDLERVALDLAREHPATNKDRSVIVEPLRDALVESDLRATSLLFLGVVGFVLLMCCVNVANLLLARTAGRARELAVRSALGAARGRIVAQLLTEGVVLAMLGGVLGLAVGAAILRAVPSFVPQGILPPAVVLTFDVRVAAFCAVTALLVSVFFGVAPAWQATGTMLVEALSSDGRTVTTGGSRLRGLLVIAEIAAAVLLLCGAGLLLRTLVAMGQVDAGYRGENVLAVQPGLDYGLPTSMFGSEDALRQFLNGVEREVASLPGVATVGWGTSLPLMGSAGFDFEIVGDDAPVANSRPRADRQLVSPGYLPTLGVPIMAGRGFTEQDTAASPPVCIVSEAVVRQHFGGRNPIGMRIVDRQLVIGPRQPVVREIVGVAADVRRNLAEVEESRALYVPIAQNPWSFTMLVVKPHAGSPEALVPGVRAAVARVDPRVPLVQIRTLDDMVGLVTARPRFRAVLVTTFATLALLLAMVGVFGVLACSVQQRRREFGVRIALGATRGTVLRLVLGGAGRLIASGAIIGLVLALMFARSISTFLFGVRPLDPVTFAATIAVLGATAAVAAMVPALQATRIDPVVAFRND